MNEAQKPHQSQELFTPEEEIRFLLKQDGQFSNAHKELVEALVSIGNVSGATVSWHEEGFLNVVLDALHTVGLDFNPYDTSLQDSIKTVQEMQRVTGAYKQGTFHPDRNQLIAIEALLGKATELAAAVGMQAQTLQLRQKGS